MIIGILIFSTPKDEQYAGVERLTQAATQMGHQIVHLYEPYFSLSGSEIWYEGKAMPQVDVIIARPNFIEEPGLHAHVVRALLTQGYRVINGLRSYGPAKNKIEQIQQFEQLGIPYPSSVICKRPDLAIDGARRLGFPVIIKVAFGTVGSGVFYADSEETFGPIADYLNIRDRNPILVQQFVAEAQRKDLRVFVVGSEIVAAMERTAPERDVRANATHGGVGTPVELSPDERILALRVAKTFELEIAGVDLIRSVRGPLVLEVNANPGFAELERATGVDVAEAIMRYTIQQHQIKHIGESLTVAKVNGIFSAPSSSK
ncbi:RimK family alpha-L-glutamate ligase [Candidatus Uhrbacteria bacterium]|nr:RimK family alpha-L-glutamate ligase [Candidatus Uhrbacteria bacterium]